MKEDIKSRARRRFLANMAAAGAALPLLRVGFAGAASLPHLTQQNNASAKALHYVDDNTKAGPPHKAGEMCANCMHFQGKPGATWGPCAIFPGFDVHHDGWCDGWAAKPGAG